MSRPSRIKYTCPAVSRDLSGGYVNVYIEAAAAAAVVVVSTQNSDSSTMNPKETVTALANFSSYTYVHRSRTAKVQQPENELAKATSMYIYTIYEIELAIAASAV